MSDAPRYKSKAQDWFANEVKKFGIEPPESGFELPADDPKYKPFQSALTECRKREADERKLLGEMAQRYTEKLKNLGIESAEVGATLTNDDSRFQPYQAASAEYQRELEAFHPELAEHRRKATVTVAWPTRPDVDPVFVLGEILRKMEPKLIYLNGVHPDERTKCPIRPVDLQFCREAWEAARSAGVRFRDATRHDLKTAEDELDYLTGLKAAIEDHLALLAKQPEPQSGGAKPVDEANDARHSIDQSDIVDTGQIAALVRKTNKTVLRWLAENPLILPHSEGGGGDATLWRWSEVRERIAEKSRRDMPEQFTGNI